MELENASLKEQIATLMKDKELTGVGTSAGQQGSGFARAGDSAGDDPDIDMTTREPPRNKARVIPPESPNQTT